MALIFAILVPVGIVAALVTANLQKPAPRTKAIADTTDEFGDPIDLSQAGERKPRGGPPVVEYKSSADDPTLIRDPTLELPCPKTEPAPPIFKGTKPYPKPGPKDFVSTPKPPPP